ncbi:unnamed protein product [Rotaria sp. Silwood1]|nr:unnamed protein product [Rotaria sp. Silwood1]CAF0947997.1 unnamed protein product [Rotaria sp. Silwood1]CAF3360785.1 unnamed protein product [Rotaria sp. Silwood1]CAF3396369.1 unnamed protein product [Rotaria sp. Silwood1]CAF4615917.1 unnamed protein product [Rotaria sp. Silwood1]
MSQVKYEQKFCEARELITDNELRGLANKYHNRHPTFSIDIQERSCKTIIFACIYHYRHIEIDLKCQCIYNDILHKFEYNWSTDDVEYKKILEHIFLRLNSSSNRRSLDDQIESIIEQITKYFIQLKPIKKEAQEQSFITIRHSSTSSSLPIEIVKYSQSPQSQRRNLFDRSLSWSQSLTSSPIYNESNSILVERQKKN